MARRHLTSEQEEAVQVALRAIRDELRSSLPLEEQASIVARHLGSDATVNAAILEQVQADLMLRRALRWRSRP